jgi:hypothetical protein
MSSQPLEVFTAIDDLIKTRLQEKDREKSRGENLDQINCSGGCVHSCHDPPSLSEMIQICRCPECSFEKKQGRGLSRAPVWQDCFAILLLRRADLGVVREVQIVVVPTIEVDPTLNDTV